MNGYDPKQHPYGEFYYGYPDIALYKFTPEELQKISLESFGPANENLVGHIETENQIDIPVVGSLMNPVVAEIDHVLDNYFRTSRTFVQYPQPPVISSCWVNKQKKYEFNPIHNHDGVYSFVIWYDIPYTREEENKASPYKPNDGRNKSGAFAYGDKAGHWIHLAESKDWNGIAAIFASTTMHCVYPFYSTDKERITIAGNYLYDNRNQR